MSYNQRPTQLFSALFFTSASCMITRLSVLVYSNYSKLFYRFNFGYQELSAKSFSNKNDLVQQLPWDQVHIKLYH